MSRIWIVQKPRSLRGIDMAAAERIGEVEYLLPAAPNVHDQERMDQDIARMTDVINAAPETDAFTFIGGSPFSQMMFGIAAGRSNKRTLLMGMYSRGIDDDGRRGGEGGSYRLIPVAIDVPA